MKSALDSVHALVACVAAITLVVFVAGCASTPKVDWNSRVGTFTYDQAVTELGPPDRSSKLEDGTVVADWFHRGSRGGLSLGAGTGISSGHVGVFGGQTISSGVVFAFCASRSGRMENCRASRDSRSEKLFVSDFDIRISDFGESVTLECPQAR